MLKKKKNYDLLTRACQKKSWYRLRSEVCVNSAMPPPAEVAPLVSASSIFCCGPSCFRNALRSLKTIPKRFDCPFFAPMAVGAFVVCLAFALTLCTNCHNQPSASMSLMLVALTAVAGLLLLYFFFQRSSTPKARCILFNQFTHWI
jgi:hypothetical protein